MPNDKLNQIVTLDFETGGLEGTVNPITEVGILSFRADTFEEISRYSSYVKCYENTKEIVGDEKDGILPYVGYNNMPYTMGALNYSNISFEQLKDGVEIKEVVKRMAEEFKKANTANSHTKKPILMGHNIGFDISFLQFAFKFCKVDLSKLLDGKNDGYGNFAPFYIDTMYQAKQRWAADPTVSSYKLELCCNKLEIELIDAHGAINDVIATKDLYVKMVSALRTEGAGSLDFETSSNVSKVRKTFQF